MNWRYTLNWRTSLNDPNPQQGQISLGQDLHFDEPLAAFKTHYENHVEGLTDVIHANPVLSKIIQFGGDEEQEE
jgi:hypothetical protein